VRHPAGPGQIAFSKSGDLFVATASGTAVYSFNATNGTLTALSGSPVAGAGSTTNGNATPIAAQERITTSRRADRPQPVRSIPTTASTL
jgi:hypothetical protein